MLEGLIEVEETFHVSIEEQEHVEERMEAWISPPHQYKDLVPYNPSEIYEVDDMYHDVVERENLEYKPLNDDKMVHVCIYSYFEDKSILKNEVLDTTF